MSGAASRQPFASLLQHAAQVLSPHDDPTSSQAAIGSAECQLRSQQDIRQTKPHTVFCARYRIAPHSSKAAFRPNILEAISRRRSSAVTFFQFVTGACTSKCRDNDLENRSCGLLIENHPCRRVPTRRSYALRAYLLAWLQGKIMRESKPIEQKRERRLMPDSRQIFRMNDRLRISFRFVKAMLIAKV